MEATTIVGESRDKLRVALTTLERNLVRKKKLFQKPQYFLVVDGYDPRIHALYFCPQLYRKEDGGLVSLSGQEIGQLIAQAMERGAVEKSPWYGPSDGVPEQPIIDSTAQVEFDSLVIDSPSAPVNEPTTLRPPPPESEKVKAQSGQAGDCLVCLSQISVFQTQPGHSETDRIKSDQPTSTIAADMSAPGSVSRKIASPVA